jgi:hypothetical protein
MQLGAATPAHQRPPSILISSSRLAVACEVNAKTEQNTMEQNRTQQNPTEQNRGLTGAAQAATALRRNPISTSHDGWEQLKKNKPHL